MGPELKEVAPAKKVGICSTLKDAEFLSKFKTAFTENGTFKQGLFK